MEQTNSSTTQQHYQHEQDELDIGLLFRKIWLQKNIIVGFVFIVVLLVMSGFSMSYLIKPPVKEYSRVLQLNFPSASTGNYPSGQRFAASDILSVKVLREVYKINDLGSHNLDERKFLEAFSVSHYATNVDYINKKFASLLANDKLSRPEIEGLEEEYLQQLNTARAKFVKIAFVNSSLLTLNNVLIDKVLIDIPKIWSRMSIKELGVLNLKVTSGDYYEIDIGERLEYVNMLDYLRKGSDDLDNALSILLADEIGGSIQNIETGMSVMDLKDQLDNLTQFEIQPLFSTITNLGIVKSKFKAKLYLQNTIQDLSDQKISLQEKQRNYQLILDAYVKRFATGQSQQNNTTGTKNSGFTQFDGSFFDRITAMIEDKSDTKYKQKLLDGQLAILQEIETTNSKLLKLQRALL
ncbi:MAG: hypothetical protein HRT35_29890, partial [Algicola sp.]|nr:hypothetical protein [Algicola sp.]